MLRCRFLPLTAKALRAVPIFRDPKLQLGQITFASIPSLHEVSPDNIYSEYTSPKGLWHDSGRKNDVIMFHQRRKAISDQLWKAALKVTTK